MGPCWDLLGTVLGSILEGLGSKSRCQQRTDENVKIAFSHRWESNFQDLEASKKHQESMPKRLAKHVPKKFPKHLSKSLPKWSEEGPRGFQKKVNIWLRLKEEAKKRSKMHAWRQLQKESQQTHQKRNPPGSDAAKPRALPPSDSLPITNFSAGNPYNVQRLESASRYPPASFWGPTGPDPVLSSPLSDSPPLSVWRSMCLTTSSIKGRFPSFAPNPAWFTRPRAVSTSY